MEDQSLEQLLEQLDKDRNIEFPVGFRHRQSIDKLQRFVASLQHKLKMHLHVDTGDTIQDAPFHSQVYLPSIHKGISRNHVLRFSNFGNLVAVHDEKSAEFQILESVTQLLAEHDYILVPERIYNMRYTGNKGGIDPITTWWDRYFDWL